MDASLPGLTPSPETTVANSHWTAFAAVQLAVSGRVRSLQPLTLALAVFANVALSIERLLETTNIQRTMKSLCRDGAQAANRIHASRLLPAR